MGVLGIKKFKNSCVAQTDIQLIILNTVQVAGPKTKLNPCTLFIIIIIIISLVSYCQCTLHDTYLSLKSSPPHPVFLLPSQHHTYDLFSLLFVSDCRLVLPLFERCLFCQ